jgi:purine nucleoside phosphorylase
MTYTYDYFKKSADYIRSVTDFEPEIAIILGSNASGPSRLHRCAGEENGSSPHFIFRSVLTNTLLLNIIQ